MAFTLTLTQGRQLAEGEPINNTKLNEMTRISGEIEGQAGAADISAGAVTAAKTRPDAHWFASATLAAGVYAATFSPAPTALTDGLALAFKAASANAGPVNLDANALGAKPLRKWGGAQLLANDIVASQIVSVRYNATLVAGGCWEIQSDTVGLPDDYVTTPKLVDASVTTPKLADASVTEDKLAFVTVSPTGHFNHLRIYNNADSPLFMVDVVADEVLLKTAAGRPLLLETLAFSVNLTAAGVGGLDTGTEASATWYYIWAIHKPAADPDLAVTAGLFSTSPTAPTLPTGYTYRALLGAVRNDNSGDFIQFRQVNRTVAVQEQLLGDPKTGTDGYWVMLGVTAFVPATARLVRGNMGTLTSAACTMAVSCSNQGISIGNGTIGVVRAQFGNSAGPSFGPTVEGFRNAVSFELPLQISSGIQSFQYATTDLTVGKYHFSVTGYEL